MNFFKKIDGVKVFFSLFVVLLFYIIIIVGMHLYHGPVKAKSETISAQRTRITIEKLMCDHEENYTVFVREEESQKKGALTLVRLHNGSSHDISRLASKLGLKRLAILLGSEEPPALVTDASENEQCYLDMVYTREDNSDSGTITILSIHIHNPNEINGSMQNPEIN